MRILIVAAALLLAGCVHKVPVKEIETKIVERPVPVECVDTRPDRVTPIKERYSREEWDAMTTDQRDALLHGNNARRLIYENEAEVIITGCELAAEEPQ